MGPLIIGTFEKRAPESVSVKSSIRRANLVDLINGNCSFCFCFVFYFKKYFKHFLVYLVEF